MSTEPIIIIRQWDDSSMAIWWLSTVSMITCRCIHMIERRVSDIDVIYQNAHQRTSRGVGCQSDVRAMTFSKFLHNAVKLVMKVKGNFILFFLCSFLVCRRRRCFWGMFYLPRQLNGVPFLISRQSQVLPWTLACWLVCFVWAHSAGDDDDDEMKKKRGAERRMKWSFVEWRKRGKKSEREIRKMT